MDEACARGAADPPDADFSADVLADLYTYRQKSRVVAWLLWGVLGVVGGHRFYLQRPFTGLAMFFTGGGAGAWWLVDAALIERMVRRHNTEQELRERMGDPPLELAFMPPLRKEELARTPGWVQRWNQRGKGRNRLRLAGDILVLLFAGAALGTAVGVEGALEALVAVVLLAVMTTLGAGPAWLDDVPGFRALTRWTHRLRLFYWYNGPASPLTLLLRSVLGIFWAPFRAKDRAEVRLYVELGAAFTAGFLLLDVVSDVVVPLLLAAEGFAWGEVLSEWMTGALVTFFLTYALAAPVGGVLTLYLLLRPTHTVPRLLAGLTMTAMALGLLAGWR